MPEDDFAAVPERCRHVLRDLCAIDHDPYNLLGNGGNPFEFNVALVDEWAFRGLQRPRQGSSSSSTSASSSSSSFSSSPSALSWRPCAPNSKSPLAPPLLPTKRKATTASLDGSYNRHAMSRVLRRRAEPEDRVLRLRHSASVSVSVSADSDEPGLLTLAKSSSMSTSVSREPGEPPCRSRPVRTRSRSPPPRVTIDHTAFPHIMAAIIGASSRQVLHTLYNTSRGMRALVGPLLESHVVLGLRNVGGSDGHVGGDRVEEAGDEAGPTIDLKPYGCAALPWSSWKGWADPKPIHVSYKSLATFGRRIVSSLDPSPHLIEMPTFNSMLAASEAQLTSAIRSVLHRARVIDLMDHLRLPPRQPTIAAPDVLRVHIHEPPEMDEYQRVDCAGWDEHTLNRFTPRRLVVLSRFIDYWSTDTSSTQVAMAPSCPVNKGTQQLVLRIAYNVDDPRLSQSTIRVPTMYRPGLPVSVKEITIILIPREAAWADEHQAVNAVMETVEEDSDNDDDVPLRSIDDDEHRDTLPTAASSASPGSHIVRLGMLDSTADWVAGYLPRGVKFTIAGVERLPGTALHMGLGRPTARESAAALTAAVRAGIVKQRRLTDETAIDDAMQSLSVVTLEEYRELVGANQYDLETVE